jgi:hypothetical protein
MATVNEKMTAIADAIREKTGDTEKLSLDGMAEALRKLPGPIVATASGSPISLTDATDLKLRGLKLFGKTTQNGTPTPEAPVPLVSAGDGGAISITISGENTQTQTLPVSTPNGLPGIPVTSGGNYTDETGKQWVCDEVDFGRGVYVQRVFTNVFSDSSRWVLSGAASGAKRFGYQAYSSVIKGSSTQGAKANILCSSFPITSAEGTWNKIEGICADTSGIVYVYYGDIEQTLQGWGNYLASNPVTFMAVLATPIETALSAEELAAYAALHTNYPNTTILNDGGAGMEVQYVADTKLYIDNKINAMAAAIVNA